MVSKKGYPPALAPEQLTCKVVPFAFYDVGATVMSTGRRRSMWLAPGWTVLRRDFICDGRSWFGRQTGIRRLFVWCLGLWFANLGHRFLWLEGSFFFRDFLHGFPNFAMTHKGQIQNQILQKKFWSNPHYPPNKQPNSPMVRLPIIKGPANQFPIGSF
jgi:hypothetical protein